MIRTFDTHRVRFQKELTGQLWQFTPCQGEYAGRSFPVAVPGCWESCPGFGNYRGEGIYRTTFSGGGNLRLEFKGVSHTAMVWLDGREIAAHYNAYTPFDAIVTGVPEGEHRLEVRADNRFSRESALHIPNDYMSYGGISRPVVLERIGDVYLKQMHLTPFLEKGIWMLRVEAVIKNVSGTPQKCRAVVEISGERAVGDETVIAPGGQQLLEETISFVSAEAWSPENPKLYSAQAVLFQNGMIVDDLIDRFGFRQVSQEGKRILLNGKALRIKGVCRHEDHPQFGCALPYAAMVSDLNAIRHLGANSVRTSHYPNDEVFLDLCDELGILVWEENHARGLSLEDMKNRRIRTSSRRRSR